MIKPECRGGYTYRQVQEIVGDREDDFWHWMRGQTMMVCGGPDDGGNKKCEVAHGAPIVYSWDMERYLAGRPVLD